MQLAGWQNFTTASVPGITVSSDGVVVVRASFTLSAGAWGVLDDVRLVDASAVGGGGGVDKSTLTAALADASAIDQASLKPSRLAFLIEAIEIGVVVEAGSGATQADVRKATDLLRRAIRLAS